MCVGKTWSLGAKVYSSIGWKKKDSIEVTSDNTVINLGASMGINYHLGKHVDTTCNKKNILKYLLMFWQ